PTQGYRQGHGPKQTPQDAPQGRPGRRRPPGGFLGRRAGADTCHALEAGKVVPAVQVQPDSPLVRRARQRVGVNELSDTPKGAEGWLESASSPTAAVTSRTTWSPSSTWTSCR